MFITQVIQKSSVTQTTALDLKEQGANQVHLFFKADAMHQKKPEPWEINSRRVSKGKTEGATPNEISRKQ
jgi:hypothetical protein